MPVFRFVPKWSSSERQTSEMDREQGTLAVLMAARAIVQRGWMQGGWYVMEAPDGSRRLVGAGSLARRSSGTVVQACLVGAVVEAATRHSPEPMTAGPPLDALWRTLLAAEGRQLDPDRRVPSPAARAVQVRELTRWNDHRDRTREDIVRLLDVAIGEVIAGGSAGASDQALTADLVTR